MKHIIIDARLYGPKHTGIGRYTKNLLIALSKNPKFSDYKFSLIIYKDLESEIKKDLNNHFHLIPTNIKHYSLSEQFLLPFLLYKQKPDLVHFTHFNKPILYFGKSIITIHDLIKHFYKGKETTTKNPLIYWPKYLIYLILTFINIKTNQLIVPSNFWREYIIQHFKIKPQNITTTYEATDPQFLSTIYDLRSTIYQNYIIYTGNLYPHKNIDIIFKALKKLPDLKLKIISARSFFTQKIKDKIKQYNIENQVEILGYIKDSEFQKIYSKALALVHPSFMEGFSLTGLEAMALNCPVISSNSSCLPEIYNNSVLYFNPNSSEELIEQIIKLQKSDKLREKLIKLGLEQIKKYSWEKTAEQTLQIYQKSLSFMIG